MHIKHMHEMIEKMAEYCKCDIEKGYGCLDLNVVGPAIDILKDLCEAEYYAKISKAMDKAEEEDKEEEKYMLKRFKEMYGEEDGERRFYDNYRYKSTGRFAPKGRGSYIPRRGYEEPPYYMTPEMYRDYDPEYWRDMDRMSGKMYYTDSNMSGNMSNSVSRSGNMGGNSSRGYEEYQRGYSEGRMEGYNQGKSDERNTQSRDYREGKSGTSRRGYMESRENHKDNTPESKQANMRELEKYMKSLSEDLTEAIEGASNEEKTMLKSKLQTLVQKI